MTSGKKDQDEVHHQDGENPVYDFFYIDRARVSNLLTQLDPNGISTSLISTRGRTSDISLGGKVSASLHAEGSIPLIVQGDANGGIEGDTASKRGHFQTLAHSFDTSYNLPLSLMQWLNSSYGEQLVSDNLEKSGISSLVRVQKHFFFQDWSSFPEMFPIMNKILSNEEAVKTLKEQNKKHGLKFDNRHIHDLLQKQADKYRNLLTVRSFIEVNEDNPTKIWMSLNSDFLISPAHEIGLKFSKGNIGEWQVLGILDCRPDSEDPKTEGLILVDPSNMTNKAINLTEIELIFKKIIGRPWDAYSLTPLLIFRRIERK